MAGAIFETAVLMEIMKTVLHRGEEPRLYFWRTSDGSEVDFVADTGTALIPIEAKTSATPRPGMASGIQSFRDSLGAKAGPGYVVHPGDVQLPLVPDVIALPFSRL
jgi:predicted AAA+ superfamily ATPase